MGENKNNNEIENKVIKEEELKNVTGGMETMHPAYALTRDTSGGLVSQSFGKPSYVKN